MDTLVDVGAWGCFIVYCFIPSSPSSEDLTFFRMNKSPLCFRWFYVTPEVNY